MADRFVSKLARLAKLGKQEVAVLSAATANARLIPRREDLIREGDRPGPIIVVLAGWAYRYKILPDGTRQILAFLMPGDSCDLHVGPLAEMDHSIQTIVPCTIATIDRAAMDSLMERFPEVAKAMYFAQLVDEGTMRAWITSMGRRSSIQRVAHLMCELYIRAANIGLSEEGVVVFPLSQVMLADALGMTAVHLNRVLKALRGREVMALTRGNLAVTDALQLARIAGFDENYLSRRVQVA
jgi:CRP-like cAMP-binding protein